MLSLAILSVIHGNLVALETVLAELAQRSIDQTICLGVVAASGPQPRAVMDRLRRGRLADRARQCGCLALESVSIHRMYMA